MGHRWTQVRNNSLNCDSFTSSLPWQNMEIIILSQHLFRTKHIFFENYPFWNQKKVIHLFLLLPSFSFVFVIAFYCFPVCLVDPFELPRSRLSVHVCVKLSSISVRPAELHTKSVVSARQLMRNKVEEPWSCSEVEEQNIHLCNQFPFLCFPCSLSRSASWSSPWCAASPCWWLWFSQQLIFGARMRMESRRRTAAGTAGEL